MRESRGPDNRPDLPKLPANFLSSERIIDLIKKMNEYPIVEITAPSGYGKTTLINAALNAAGSDCKVFRYHFDSAKTELSDFYSHFAEMLFPKGECCFPDISKSPFNFYDIHSNCQHLNAVICQQLWSISNNNGKRTFIVLDNFHNVQGSFEITETLRCIMDNLPPKCAVFISGNRECAAVSVKQRLTGRVLEVHAADLRFTQDELELIILRPGNAKIPLDILQKLIIMTEGQAAAVVLVSHGIGQLETRDTGDISGKTGNAQILYNFFAVELFQNMDRTLLCFLVRVSLLKDFTASGAGLILNLDNAGLLSVHVDQSDFLIEPGAQVRFLIEQGDQAGFFQKDTSHAETVYRFHNLIHEVLSHIVSEYLTEEDIENIHVKAAAFYFENKRYNEAFIHCSMCNDTPKMTEMLETRNADLIILEALEPLKQWFMQLTEDTVESSGTLLYIKTFIQLQGDNEKAAAAMEKANLLFIKAHNAVMQLKTAIYNIYINECKNDARSIIRICRKNTVPANRVEFTNEALSINEAESSYIAESSNTARLFWIIGLIRMYWEEKYLEVSDMICSKHSDTLDEDCRWMYRAYACKAYLLLGQLDTAIDHIKETFEMDMVRRNELIQGFALLYYCMVLAMKNDAAQLGQALERLLPIGEKHNILFILGFGKRLMAFKSYVGNDYKVVSEQLQSSAIYFKKLKNRSQYALNILLRCLWLSNKENIQQLLLEAENQYATLLSEKSGSAILEIAQSIIGALEREAGEYKKAEVSLLAALKRSTRQGLKQVVCGTLFHLAKLYYDTAEEHKADNVIRQAFSIASENQYKTFWDIHLPTLTAVTLAAIKKNIHGDYARGILEDYYKKETVDTFLKAMITGEEVNPKELYSTFISFHKPTPHLYVYMLGTFSMGAGEINIPVNGWKTRMAGCILKYLLLNKDRMISRKSLAELFWPEIDLSSALVSLRSALHEMKKGIAMSGIALEDKDSLLIEKNGSLGIKAQMVDYMDVDELKKLYSQWKNLPKDKAGIDQRETVLENILNIYKGNLLEEDLYEDWFAFEREKLKSIWLESMLSLSEIYNSKHEFIKKEHLLLQVLAFDPFNEDACADLLKLYLRTNQRSRAVKMYESFAERMNRDLGISPNDRLSCLLKLPK